MTMIKRMATVLAEDAGDGSDWTAYRDAAVKAIEAMREPTKAMIVAAMITPSPTVAEAGGILQQARQHTRLEWQAMIDAALTEQPE